MTIQDKYEYEPNKINITLDENGEVLQMIPRKDLLQRIEPDPAIAAQGTARAWRNRSFAWER